MENDIINNMMTRTSIRKYLTEEIENEKIETILKAGMAAPSAMNKQPWHFVVVKNKEKLKNISKYESPIAIVVCGDMDKTLAGDAKDFWVLDASIASENIILAAHSLGLDTVWTAVYPIESIEEKVKKELVLSDNLVPLNVINVGYADEEVQIKDKWNKNNITYVE